MEARYVALLILVPFAFVFAYATWHEYKRFKAEGRSSYGLTYDPETNTTHVGPIPEDEEAYDLDDYDPDLLETTAKEAEEDGMADRDGTETDEERETEDPQDDDKPQDTRT